MSHMHTPDCPHASKTAVGEIYHLEAIKSSFPSIEKKKTLRVAFTHQGLRFLLFTRKANLLEESLTIESHNVTNLVDYVWILCR